MTWRISPSRMRMVGVSRKRRSTWDAVADHALFEQGEDSGDEVVDVGLRGAGGLAVEAQGLHGDLRDAVELVAGHVQIAAGIVGDFGLADEEDAVGDGFEGVVDLVGDGGGEATGDGELFRAAEDLFAALLQGEVGDEGGELLIFWAGGGVEQGGANEGLDLLAGGGKAAGFQRL